MGKSDPYVFKEYENLISGLESNSTAFLGFSSENSFTRKVSGSVRDFYDLSLGNWDINDEWFLDRKYNLIVCTRCAYFSKDPQKFIDKCKEHLKPGGHALIDWCLGDHWRFDKYKVGWIKDGEHEFAYKDDNFLYSCFWREDLLEDENVKNFWKNVRESNLGYQEESCLQSIIEKEVPKIVQYKTERLTCVSLWPERPQLYIVTLIKND